MGHIYSGTRQESDFYVPFQKAHGEWYYRCHVKVAGLSNIVTEGEAGGFLTRAMAKRLADRDKVAWGKRLKAGDGRSEMGDGERVRHEGDQRISGVRGAVLSCHAWLALAPLLGAVAGPGAAEKFHLGLAVGLPLVMGAGFFYLLYQWNKSEEAMREAQRGDWTPVLPQVLRVYERCMKPVTFHKLVDAGVLADNPQGWRVWREICAAACGGAWEVPDASGNRWRLWMRQEQRRMHNGGVEFRYVHPSSLAESSVTQGQEVAA